MQREAAELGVEQNLARIGRPRPGQSTGAVAAGLEIAGEELVGRERGAVEADADRGQVVEPAAPARLAGTQPVEVDMEAAAVEWRRNGPLVRAARDRGIRFGPVVQRSVGAERIEGAQPWSERRRARHRAAKIAVGLARDEPQRIGIESPDEQPDMRDVVAPRPVARGCGGGAVARMSRTARAPRARSRRPGSKPCRALPDGHD